VKVLRNEHLNCLPIENTSGVPRDRIKEREKRGVLRKSKADAPELVG
jgi:hypothetical protein